MEHEEKKTDEFETWLAQRKREEDEQFAPVFELMEREFEAMQLQQKLMERCNASN